MTRQTRAGRLASLIAAGVMCGATLVPAATAATAAQLSVTVTPANVHPQQTYTVTVTGRYGKGVSKTPHLYAFIQYSGRSCQPTATAEYALPTAEWGWLVFPPSAQPGSPIHRVFQEQAKTRVGLRRVCAYLYAGSITPKSTVKPLAVASASFRDTKP